MERARTLGELKESDYKGVSVKDELRANLICKLKRREKLFPGIVGYDETVVPQLVNAILSRHNLILLGLRGQAKSRIIRQLTHLMDKQIPIIAGSEVNDDPFHPISAYGRQIIELHQDSTPIAWVDRDARFVEKLATPDVTIADIIGDVDPIKAAKGGHLLSDELTIHYGLLPRANRGIFAINELPDLAGKIQVGLFNIMQEGDVQIKRLPGASTARCDARLFGESGRLHRARKNYFAFERIASARKSRRIIRRKSNWASRLHDRKRGSRATD